MIFIIVFEIVYFIYYCSKTNAVISLVAQKLH